MLKLQEQIRADQADIAQQREQLYRKMEILTSQGLLISPSVAIPVTGHAEDSSNHSSEESSPQSEGSGITGGNSSGGSIGTSNTSTLSYAEKKKDAKWTKGLGKSLPLNLISTTNQHKVSQVPIKQQIPLKLASRLSSGNMTSNNASSGTPSGQCQMLPLKLSQEEKVRRTSTGYQRLGSDSLSPTSGETVC